MAIVIPDDIREFVWLDESTTPATLWVDENNIRARRIQSFVADRIAAGLTIRPVSLTDIRQHQELHAGEHSSHDASERQQQALQLFRDAEQAGASDIHFEVGRGDATLMMLRVNGDLQPVDSITTDQGMQLTRAIYDSMCDIRSSPSFHALQPQDGRLSPEFLQQAGLFAARYLHLPTTFGLKVVMRLITHGDDVLTTLEEQGFLPEQVILLRELIRSPSGMLVTSGPTGSGKSTTLRTLCGMYISFTGGTKCLLTVEDPVEGHIRGAVQSAIVADRNDAEAVREAWSRFHSASVRADPDAMMIGEVRDKESAHTAVITTQAGHPAYSTTHTDDPFGILDRFASFGTDADLLFNPRIFSCLISQRLVQRLCPHCKQSWAQAKDRLSAEEQALVTRHCNPDRVFFRNPQGCQACRKEVRNVTLSAGIAGRTVIAEVVRTDARMLSVFRDKGRLAARQHWIDGGGKTLLTHLMHYVHHGEVDPLHGHSVVALDEDSRTSLREVAPC